MVPATILYDDPNGSMADTIFFCKILEKGFLPVNVSRSNGPHGILGKFRSVYLLALCLRPMDKLVIVIGLRSVPAKVAKIIVRWVFIGVVTCLQATGTGASERLKDESMYGACYTAIFPTFVQGNEEIALRRFGWC